MAQATIEKSKSRFYTRRKAAEYRGESVSTIIRDEKAKRLTPVRFRPGGQVHYRAEEIEATPKLGSRFA